MPAVDEWDMPCTEAKQQPVNDPGGALLWDSQQNRVIGNVLDDNRVADILVASVSTDVSTLGNCALGNTFTLSLPKNIETLAPCDGTGSGDWKDGEYNIAAWLGEERPPSVDWKTATLPALEPQENMPDAATAPANPATNVPYAVDLAAITVPAKPA
jgi:hypothetical protein